jgi:hypothetical protein
MIEEVDRVNAVSGPGSLTVEEGVQMVEVDFAGQVEVDGVLVTTGAGLGGASLM